MALWTPEYIDTALWLDAADSSTITESGGLVSAWADKSGNGRDVTQSTPSYRPSVVANNINNLDAIDFSMGDTLNTASAVLTDDVHLLFIVVKAAPLNNAHIITQHTGGADVGRVVYIGSSDTSPFDKARFFFNNGTSYAGFSSTAAFSSVVASIICCRSDGEGNWALYVNGAGPQGILSGQTLSPLNTSLMIGGYGLGGTYVGKVGEVLIVTALDDRQNIEGYLAHKWDLTANLPADHPYKSAAPQALSISGTITGADGNPAARIVRAYDRSTGALIHETTSDASTGFYDLGFATDDEIYRIVLADEGALYNDIIDRVIPG